MLKYLLTLICLPILGLAQDIPLAEKTLTNKMDKNNRPLGLEYKTNGYEYKGHVDGIKDTTCMMAYYLGDKQYAIDTADINSSGDFVFKGDDGLEHGMYLIVFPEGQYMEMVVAEDKFSFSSELENLAFKMKFSNSNENEKFYTYLQFLENKQKQVGKLRKNLESANTSQKGSINEKIDLLNTEVKNYQNVFKKQEILFAKILLASDEIKIPDAPVNSEGSIDSNFQFNYYKAHFFDNLDWSDKRMLRTPIIHNKINTYLEKLTYKVPDSIIVSCDYLINKSRANDAMFRYMVSYLTSTYERTKIMGLEKVFVHLVETYYKTNEADWIDETQMFKIIDRAETIKPLMLEQIAPNLSLRDPADKVHVLHQIEEDFTVLIFYDPDCGHCKKEMPVIKQYYDEWLEKGISVKVYAVTVELDKEKWIKFIETYDIANWINVGEFKTYVDGEYNRENDIYVTPFPYIKQLYDINGTPKVYLLDKDKKILVNAIKGNIGVEQLSKIITEIQ